MEATRSLTDLEIDSVTGGSIAIPVGVILFTLGVLFGAEGLQFGETKAQAAQALGVEHLL